MANSKKLHFSKLSILNRYGCQAKNAFFVFFACFRPYVGQPDNHIGCVALMPSTSIYPADPRTNSAQFRENNIEN